MPYGIMMVCRCSWHWLKLELSSVPYAVDIAFAIIRMFNNNCLQRLPDENCEC